MPIDIRKALDLTPNTRQTFLGNADDLPMLVNFGLAYHNPILIVSLLALPAESILLAGTHLAAERPWNFTDLAMGLVEPVTLVTGPEVPGEGYQGMNPDLLESAKNLADLHGTPLLILAQHAYTLTFASGSGGLISPIPPFCTSVVAYQSMEDWRGEENMLKRINSLYPEFPETIKKILILEGDGSEQAKTRAASLGKVLRGGVYRVLLSKRNEEGGLIFSTAFQRTAGVVLAGGESRRIGYPKQLLTWEGEPFLRHIVRMGLSAGLDPMVVILGANWEEVIPSLKNLPVEIVKNHEWQQGQSTSVRKGVSVLPEDVAGAVFLLVDQPQIPETLVRTLVEKHAATLGDYVLPLVADKRGNPVLFDARLFPDMLVIEGDQGGRAIFTKFTGVEVPWLDEIVALDVDTKEDYQKLKDWYQDYKKQKKGKTKN